jgi:hypothetical protein
MDVFNYVMVLSSVIIGLGITHLLQGGHCSGLVPICARAGRA